LARFWLSFFGWLGFGLVFSVSLGFGSVFSGLARFGLVFQFQTYKTETEPVGFFKILIGFFHGSVFSVIFFSSFLNLINFSVFFSSLKKTQFSFPAHFFFQTHMNSYSLIF
jgi:hypothetical protein